MEKRWRLIVDDPAAGCRNMAVDEAIFLSYADYKRPTLRLYGWKEPTLSLGYKQKPLDVLRSSDRVPFVRRMTGGAAIFHDRELTYSITCSERDLDLGPGVKQSYYRLCFFLKIFYKKLGLDALFAGEADSKKVSPYGSYCFSSLQAADLTIQGKKIGGNAQRRRRDIIFQHGSIPQSINFKRLSRIVFDVEELKLNTVSLESLLGRKTHLGALQSLLAESFAEAFCLECSRKELLIQEQDMVNELLTGKYQDQRWNNAGSQASLAG